MMSKDKREDDAREEPRETFVPEQDRPEMRLTPDTPLSELRVRDLTRILGIAASKNWNLEMSLKDFLDKPDFEGSVKVPEATKPISIETGKETYDKYDKLEKHEKHEKHEVDKSFRKDKAEGETVFSPGSAGRPVPDIAQVVEALAGLAQRVGHLADQIKELKRKESED